MQVLLRAPFDTFSGYGNDAVDIAIWLRRAGVDVVPYPTAILPGLPREFLALLEKAPLKAPDVALMFGPPRTLRPEVVHGFDGPVVGWTMWERDQVLLDDVSDEFDDGEAWRPWSTWMDRLLVTCPMNIDAFRAVDPALEAAGQPFVVPCGIDPDEKRWPLLRRDTDRPTRYLWVGTGAPRKDPFVLLTTWRRLKAAGFLPDETLTMHILGTGLHPGIVDAYGPDVTLSNRPLQQPDLLRLYHDHDVLISVSRGEGNNKPAMEFMATGGTVIATDWSGHQNWLYPAATYALPGDLQPVGPANPAREFHADPEALADLIVHTATHRVEVRDKGIAAAHWIRSSLSWDHCIAGLLRHLSAAS